MANKEVDLIDVAPLVVFPLMAGLALGALSFEFSLFGGFSFTEVLFSGSGAEITIAGVIATAAAVIIVATNELLNPDGFKDKMEKYLYFAGIVVIFGAVPLFMVIPVVRDFITSYDLVNFALLLAQGGAAGFVSWFR